MKALRIGICGTSNFILTAMEAQSRSFADVLAEAQALGYAEADPSFDIEGVDAAHKLAILAAMAFEMPLAFPAVYCEGIARVTPADIEFARELGYRIKHLGIARLVDAGVELRVHPTLLSADSPLAKVDGVLNAVRLHAHAAGDTVYSGAGAGRADTRGGARQFPGKEHLGHDAAALTTVLLGDADAVGAEGTELVPEIVGERIFLALEGATPVLADFGVDPT